MVFDVDLQILAHAFHIADVANVDANRLVVGLEEHRVAVKLVDDDARFLRHRSVLQFVAMLHLLGSPLKVLQAERLEQIVDGIHLEALDGILRVGRGEHDKGRSLHLLDKLHTVEVGHVDVDEDGIDYLLIHDLLGLQSALAGSHQFEVRYLLYVCGQLAQCQWLIVYG